jgi:hypothetical protein
MNLWKGQAAPRYCPGSPASSSEHVSNVFFCSFAFLFFLSFEKMLLHNGYFATAALQNGWLYNYKQ